MAPLSPDARSDVDFFADGRISFHLKGKVQGKYIMTAHLDTGEEGLDDLFDTLHEKDPRGFLRRLDPDRYYPVYGDASSTLQDAESQGKLYARMEWDRPPSLGGISRPASPETSSRSTTGASTGPSSSIGALPPTISARRGRSSRRSPRSSRRPWRTTSSRHRGQSLLPEPRRPGPGLRVHGGHRGERRGRGEPRRQRQRAWRAARGGVPGTGAERARRGGDPRPADGDERDRPGARVPRSAGAVPEHHDRGGAGGRARRTRRGEEQDRQPPPGAPEPRRHFRSNDDCALGALASIRAAGRTGVIIVGFYAIPEARTAILEDSPLRADAIQYPVEIGRRTIETVVAHLAGTPVPSRIPVRVGQSI